MSKVRSQVWEGQGQKVWGKERKQKHQEGRRGGWKSTHKPSAYSEMHTLGKREGSGSRAASLELKSILFKECREHLGKNSCSHGPGDLVSTWETPGGQ